MSATWLKREEKRKVTFRIGKNETEIDFLLDWVELYFIKSVNQYKLSHFVIT